MDCRHVEFSPGKSRERFERALNVFPRKLLMRLVAFVLHLLGAKRRTVAELVGMPEESVKTAIRVIERDGFLALRDRRSAGQSYPAAVSAKPSEVSVFREGEWINVSFGPDTKPLRVPHSHPVQARTVLLSLFNSGLVSAQQTASLLGISAAHCRELARRLAQEDVTESLVDKRQGQQRDYRVGPAEKAEIIQQIAARIVTGHGTSSEVLAESINERTQAQLSPRTIRWHINKLGLRNIKQTLPKLVESLKKKLVRILFESRISWVPPTLSGTSGKSLAAGGTPTALAECAPSAQLSAKVAAKVADREAMVAWYKAGIQTEGIALLLQCSLRTVRRWIQRHAATGGLLDGRRSGRPQTYAEQTRLRVVAFYCQTQPLPDCGRWTLRWAERRLMADSGEVGLAPSKSTLHRILHGNRLRPHQSRYFLHITDPDFFPKMDHLIALYRNPPANLYFFDEAPGIQILKRLTPDLRTDEMCKRLEEFEYIRNGTLDVFAFLNHANGEVSLECQANHTAQTLVEVFRRQCRDLPRDEHIHYVMDNLSTHRGYPFCQVVAELSQVECPSPEELRKPSDRMQWLRRDDKRIVIHFTPFHGSWLNLIEIWLGIMSRNVLTESFASPGGLQFALGAFVNEWNTLLGHPFRWSYDGKGLPDKAVQRFIKMLRSQSAATIDTRILTNKMLLLANLITDYRAEVSDDTWRQLVATMRTCCDIICTIITDEQGPRRQKSAQRALAILTAAVERYLQAAEPLAA